MVDGRGVGVYGGGFREREEGLDIVVLVFKGVVGSG